MNFNSPWEKKLKPAILLSFLIFLTVSISGGVHAQSPSVSDTSKIEVPSGFDAAWQKLSNDFRQRLEDSSHVGGTVWMASNGRVVEREMYGFATLEPPRPIDEQTIYHWASITKTFTGIAIMQLRDRGLLSLDDPAVKYLPVLHEVHNPYGPMEAITIRMLLSHSAGFRSPTWPWGGDEPWHPHEPTAWSQLVAMMPYTKIHFEPGTKMTYSNPGIIFLGQIIEKVTGDKYETYIAKNIFMPLRMDRSYFDHTPQYLLPHRANNYTFTAEGDTVANGLDFNTGITVSNGGLNAPAGDMMNYAAFLTGSCEWDACKKVLKRSSLDEMWKSAIPQTQTLSAKVNGEKQEWEAFMGLTFFGFHRGDAKVLYHTGGQKSYSSLLIFDPGTKVAALAAFNSEGGPDTNNSPPIGELMQRLAIQEIFPLFR